MLAALPHSGHPFAALGYNPVLQGQIDYGRLVVDFGKANLMRAAAAVALCTAVAVMSTASAPVAAADADVPLRTISVSGHGETMGTPDRAHLSAGVITEGRTAAEALAANSRAMNQVFEALKRTGIPDKKIQTSNINIEPQYPPYNGNGQQPERHIVGYQVTNTVNVTVDGIDKVGPVLDALVKSGANQSYGISFDFAEPKPLEERARRDAVEEAAAKAHTLADAAGVHLGPILNINEGGYVRPVPVTRLEGIVNQLPQAFAAQVAAGQQAVSVDVSIVYEIQ